MIFNVKAAYGRSLVAGVMMLAAAGCGQDRLSSLGPEMEADTPPGIRARVVNTDCVTLDLVGIGTGRPASVTTNGYTVEAIEVDKWLTLDSGSIVLNAGGAVRISRSDGQAFVIEDMSVNAISNDVGLNVDIRVESSDAESITDSFTGTRTLAVSSEGSTGKNWYIIANTTDNGGIGSGPNLTIDALNVCLTEEVDDTTPPTISMNVSPTELSKGKKLVLVASGISASDAEDGDVALSVTVTANERIRRKDTRVVYNADGTVDVWVMPKFRKKGSGRVYSITAVATDAAGNSTTSIGQVLVPTGDAEDADRSSKGKSKKSKKSKKNRR